MKGWRLGKKRDAPEWRGRRERETHLDGGGVVSLSPSSVDTRSFSGG